MSVKVYPEDKWFSRYIRARDKWTCRRCGREYVPYDKDLDNSHLKGLHNAHCFGRGAHMTRWDERNCMALCYGCHSHVDSHPVEKLDLWVKEWGQDTVDELNSLSHTVYRGWKKDRKEIAKKYKLKVQEYE